MKILKFESTAAHNINIAIISELLNIYTIVY